MRNPSSFRKSTAFLLLDRPPTTHSIGTPTSKSTPEHPPCCCFFSLAFAFAFAFAVLHALFGPIRLPPTAHPPNSTSLCFLLSYTLFCCGWWVVGNRHGCGWLCVICSTFWAFDERTFAACVCMFVYVQCVQGWAVYVCGCLCGARALRLGLCVCVCVCIGVRAFLGVRFLVFREILAFICYVLTLTSLQSCAVAALLWLLLLLLLAVPLLLFLLHARRPLLTATLPLRFLGLCVGSPMYTIWQLHSSI